jgi:hypothetical protein
VPLNQAAAIRRSSQQARNAMQELDRAAIEQLIQEYSRAAEQVRHAIYAAADTNDRIPQERLRPLLGQIDQVLEDLGRRRDELLQAGLNEAAGLGTRPYTAQGVLAVGGSEAVLASDAAARINQDAVAFVNEVKQADGLNLSERLWRLNQGAKEALSRAIASAVIRGASAAKSAADLAYQGQQIPGDMQQLARGGQAGHVVRLADLLTGDNGEVWKAERVFRTEINRAHGEAYMIGAERTPGFAGFRFLLSPSHPRADICDLLAAQNLYGLGKGVYPNRGATPWPAHPNTLSFLVMVFKNEISAEDQAGKETPLQALQRLAPEIRAGVLGPTKAQYFDKGVLTQGMIRAPVAAVDQRVEHQAVIAARPHPNALHNWEYALVDEKKLASYALDPLHGGSGADKAKAFEAVLGLTAADAAYVERTVLEQLPKYPAVKGRQDQYGLRFHVDMPLTGPKGTAIVRTGWIYPIASDQPRLATIFLK